MPRPSKLILSLVLAVAAVPLSCAVAERLTGESSPTYEIRKGDGRYEFEETVLDNGLRVISLEDHSTPIVAVQLWYHVGSKDEHPERQGFAHMFEHMMFQGTDRLTNTDHFDYVRRTGGDCNAYTSFDQTVYIQELPANQLDMVLWLEAERMASLKIDEGAFNTERKVVEEERRLGLNQPYGTLPEKVLDFLFTRHPYRWTPIGQIEHLRAASVQDIQDFWDTYYVPNNATLVVVGDVTHDEVRQLAEKNFGWIPRCDDPPRVTVVEPEPTEKRRLEITEESGPAPIGGLVFHTVPEGHADSLPLTMLMQILGGGESSRAYIELVRRKEVAAFAGSGAVAFEQAGMAIVGGVAMPFGDADAIVEASWEQVAAIKEEGVTQKELDKVRNQIFRDNVTETLTVASKASALGNAAVIQGDAQLANTYLERVAEVTIEDIERVAQTYLVEERATEVVVKPSLTGMLGSVLSMAAGLGGDGAEPQEEEDDDGPKEGGVRATATGPKAEAPRPSSFGEEPPVAPPLAVDVSVAGERTTLDNGLRVVVVENREVPFVSASLRLKVGAFTDDPDLPGTASMATSMVTRGTVARDAEKLAAELEQYGISLGASAGHDSASVNVSSVTAQFGRSMRLLSEVVQVPAFDAKEFRTLRDQVATGMAISEKDPSTIADRTFDKAMWGDHPYGRPADGTSEDLKKLSADVLQEWWEEYVRPEAATLYIAGDVDFDSAVAMAERFFADWEGYGDPVEAPLPAWTAPTATRIKLVDRPGSVQSEIRAGHEGITRRHPLFATGVVLSQIFGGAFSSRLNEVIRVQKGLTYGAGGGLSSRRFGGMFRVRTFTKTPTTAETVQAVIDEVKRMQDEAPSGDELESAVSYLAGSFAGSLETPQAMAGRLWSLELNDLPDDYWNSYLKRISGTTATAVAAAAMDLLDPARLLIVVVGDAEKVQESLEDIAEVDLITEGG